MIVTRLIGGLGNQMFQYAAGRSLAISNNCELKLDLSGFQNYSLHNGYELSHFNIEAIIANHNEIAQLVSKETRLVKYLIKKFGLKSKKHYLEKKFNFDAGLLEVKNSVYIDGYWQSYRYFDFIRDELLQELAPISELTGNNLEMAEKIKVVNAVSLHVRRGDYISNPQANKVHGFVGVDYYHNAIDLINRRISNPYYFIFSDDIAWCKENLSLKEDVIFVNHNTGKNAFEDMRLMSLCKHNIIANSSFSWWGAWLNNNPNKVVIAPINWFAKNINTLDLIPTSWVRL